MATSSGITSLYCTNGNGLIFDFETEQFTDSFRYAIGIDQKIKFAPKLRVACVYNLNTGKYTYYRPGTTDKLIARLLNADFIVSFNGKCFDLLVLQRHHRLGKRKADQLNRKLQSAGFNLVTYDFHHDFVVLPNGHVVILANVLQPSSNGPAKSGTQNVAGDALVDLDTQFNPVWVWNSFDHLDLSRRPMGFPDWTHSNSILYTDDGNLLLSIRHQNWVVKLDYANGAGSGNVIWRLGPGGDFKLLNGNDPQDWFYAQHSPNFIGARSSGVFSMILMDNGDDRVVSPGNACNGTSEPNCYTTVLVFSIDEAARTATLTFHKIFPPEQYSFWGGSANPLANGNYEFDLCAQPNTTSEINEVLPTGELVWKMTSTGANFYRGNRIPSLYPGVQW